MLFAALILHSYTEVEYSSLNLSHFNNSFFKCHAWYFASSNISQLLLETSGPLKTHSWITDAISSYFNNSDNFFLQVSLFFLVCNFPAASILKSHSLWTSILIPMSAELLILFAFISSRFTPKLLKESLRYLIRCSFLNLLETLDIFLSSQRHSIEICD